MRDRALLGSSFSLLQETADGLPQVWVWSAGGYVDGVGSEADMAEGHEVRLLVCAYVGA